MLVYLAEHVDTQGYLIISPTEIYERTNLPMPLIWDCINILQELKPIGIASFTLEDCLKNSYTQRIINTSCRRNYSYISS